MTTSPLQTFDFGLGSLMSALMVPEGQTVRINLEEAGSCGFLWRVESCDGLKITEVPSSGPAGQEDGKPLMVGARNTRTFLVEGLKAGARQVCRMSRPWKGDQPEDNILIISVVGEGHDGI